MENAHTVILPPGAAVGDDLGLQLILEFFAECTGARWAELVIRSRRLDHRWVVTVGERAAGSVSVEMPIDDDTDAVVTLDGESPPKQRVIDLFASSIARELERLRLQAETALLQSAADFADAAVLIFGESGNILFANRRADALISKQTEKELTVVWKTQRRQPLFRLLCAKVGEALDDAHNEPWRDRIDVSDGSELTVHLVVLPYEGAEYGPAVMAILREVAGPPDQRVEDFAVQHQLSPRESEVLRLLVQGYDTTGLADRLGISPHTVRDHIKNVFRKTASRSRSELLSTLAGAGNHPR